MPQRINGGGIVIVVLQEVRCCCLVLFNHLPPAPGIAGYRIDGQRQVCRNETGIDQWTHGQQKPGWVTARVRNPRCIGNRGALVRQFWQSVDPIPGGTMCRAGIDDTSLLGLFYERYRFACRLVGQAQNDGVRLIELGRTRGGVFLVSSIDFQQANITAPSQQRMNLKPGSAVLSVNEYFLHDIDLRSLRARGRNECARKLMLL